MSGLGVGAEAGVYLVYTRWVSDPQVAGRRAARDGRPQGVAEATQDIAHGAPAFDVLRGEAADLGLAAVVVVPELDARSVEEGDEEAVDGGSPLEAAGGKVELLDDQRVQEAGEVGAGRHAHAGEWLLDGAGSADPVAGLENEDALAGAGEVGGAGESVMAGSDDDGVPGFGGELADGSGKSELAEDGCSRR